MRSPLKRKVANRGTVSRVLKWAAPIGGWMVKENAANMSEQSAYQLDNFFPEKGGIVVRPGYTFFAYSNDASEPIGTLMAYQSGTATEIFACVGDTIVYTPQEERNPVRAGVFTSAGAATVAIVGNDKLASGVFSSAGTGAASLRSNNSQGAFAAAGVGAAAFGSNNSQGVMSSSGSGVFSPKGSV